MCAVPIAEQAVVAHAVDAGRSDVQEKTPNKVRSGERHGPRGLGSVGTVILVAETDVPVVQVEQPMVGDGDPVGVTADVVEPLLRAGEQRQRILPHSVVRAGRR